MDKLNLILNITHNLILNLKKEGLSTLINNKVYRKKKHTRLMTHKPMFLDFLSQCIFRAV